MPSAQVVADRFHVMQQVNNELDTQRQQNHEAEKNSQPKFKEILAGLTKKYVLIKNEIGLNEQQKGKQQQVKLVSPVLEQMHKLEELREVFEKNSDILFVNLDTKY